MPLPPAPTKRAALLSPAVLDAPARAPLVTAPKKTRRTAVVQKPLAQIVDRDGDKNADKALRTERLAPGNRQPVTPTTPASSTPFAEKAPLSPLKVKTEQPKKDSGPPHQAAAKPKKAKPAGATRLFVLDTNVLMHDPMCLFRFEEHDIFLPMIVLEELDDHKKGMTEVARNARQTSRTLDALAGTDGADIAKGLKLDSTGHREAGGCLFFQTKPLNYSLPMGLPQGKADNQILGVVEALSKEHPKRAEGLVS